MKTFLFFLFTCLCFACGNSPKQAEPVVVPQDDIYDLADIQRSGEIIVLTLFGQDTYYEYRGSVLGFQYEVAELFGHDIGARVRMEAAPNTQELIKMLQAGEGDLIACGQHDTLPEMEGMVVFRDSLSTWMVRKDTPELQAKVGQWLTESAKARYQLRYRAQEDAKRRRANARMVARAPIKDVARGIISDHDIYFKRYANQISWDWRLLAAQAYQESAFDPQATSWAGAQGLMQLMPGTARQVNVADPYQPEEAVLGGVRYLKLLSNTFSNIGNQEERIKFMLAAYNCGPLHVKDAQALATKYGKNPNVWTGNVDEYVRLLSKPQYYRDPVVQHGYCRGQEPYNYVIQILARYEQYRQKVR